MGNDMAWMNSTIYQLSYLQDNSVRVIGLNGTNWEIDKFAIMEDLVGMKFTQCDHMKAELLKTGSKTMVESGRDIHYACGLSIVHKDIFNTAKWSGKNNLGKILGAVRDAMRA